MLGEKDRIKKEAGLNGVAFLSNLALPHYGHFDTVLHEMEQLYCLAGLRDRVPNLVRTLSHKDQSHAKT